MFKSKRLAAMAVAAFAAISFCAGAAFYASAEVSEPSEEIIESSVTIEDSAFAKKISDCTIKLSSASVTYSGKEQKPAVTVSAGEKILTEGTDYKLTYSNNIKIGKASVKVTGKGSYSGSSTLTFNILPKKVKNLTASSTTSSVTVKWDKVATCTGYKIYRYDSSTKKWKGVKNISSKTTLSWTNKNLKPNTVYKYRVKAYMNVSGKAYTGTSVQVDTKTQALPNMSGVKATPAVSSVKLSWNKASGVTGYKIYRYDPSTKKWKGIKSVNSASTTSWTNKNLVPNTEYKYRVKTFITVNGTAYKGTSTQVDTKTQALPKMSGLKATAASSTSITLTWSKAANVDGYKIYRYDTSTKAWKGVKSVNSASTLKWTNTGLTANTEYKYRVKTFVTVNGKTYAGTATEVSAKTPKATTPVSANGQLKVSGANIVNSSGQKFQIRGMSTHGIMWEDFSNILSKNSLKVLRDDWGVNTIRIAMYTEEWGGYTTDPTYAKQAKEKVNTGVANATDLGMYVIIDWHILSDGNPQTHQSEAIAFFTEMAKKYKDYNNVLYEICNEPNNGATWSGNIKPYATKVINAIRKYDDDAIIIVGTPTWSQEIDKAANDRLSDKNTVYALHFYANTHTDWLRDRFTQCYNKGLPILVSEFGTCDASGNGGYNASQTKTWLKLLDSKNVGYVNWSACGKSETASAFKSGTDLSNIKSGTSQLTESGKLIRSWYRDRAGK